MTQGADYSGGRPSGAALRAAGFDFVVRYIGLGSAGKRLTAAEYRDLTAAGVTVLLVAELGTGDSWGSSMDDDYGRGRANAAAALADAQACVIPENEIFIFAASDAHAAAQWQITDTVAYVRGFRDVLGVGRTGHYGFSETNIAVHDAGVAAGFWRCGSEPSTADKQWVNFWQRNAAPTIRVVDGVVCDINELYQPLTNQEVLVATQAEIDAIAQATVNVLMSNKIEVEPITPGQRRFVDYSALLRYDDDHLTVLRAGLAQMLAVAQAGSANADEVAAKLAPLMLPALTSSLAAEVANLDLSQVDKISDADAQQIAKAVTDRAAALLKPTA